MPQKAEHFYRLGATECLLDDETNAVKSFKKAGTLDAKTRMVDPTAASVLAGMALDEADRASAESKRRSALARFAAHTARAVSAGDQYTHKRLQETFNEADLVRLHANNIEKSVSIAVARRMVEEALHKPRS